MSKKDFSGGLNSLLGEQQVKPKRGRKKTQEKRVVITSQQGTKENETRATFIVQEELLDKVKAIAYWDRMLLKDIIAVALQDYIDKRQPKPRPEEIRLKDQEANQKLVRLPGVTARLPKY